jgi:hypothetical protein
MSIVFPSSFWRVRIAVAMGIGQSAGRILRLRIGSGWLEKPLLPEIGDVLAIHAIAAPTSRDHEKNAAKHRLFRIIINVSGKLDGSKVAQ